MEIETDRQGDVAVIRFANPPQNMLSAAVLDGLSAALHVALTDGAVRAVVLAAGGGDFCAGLEPCDAGSGLSDLCDRIEAAGKPVIAALHGLVLGDGLDLAVACHYRVAAPDTQIGATGIRLGLPPAGGATQRLPRLCGAGAALDLLLTGRVRPPMPGFLDAPPGDDPVAIAVALSDAEEQPMRAPRPTSGRRAGLGDPAGFASVVAKARAGLAGARVPAGRRIVDCVEGALLLPMETGLEMERSAHEDCAAGPESAALCHMARAERRAWDFPEAEGGRPGPLNRIAITGGTGLAGSLVRICLDAGYEVLVVEPEPEGRAVLLDHLLRHYDAAVADGTLDPALRDARLLRLLPEATFDDLDQADAVWEAGPDGAELKIALWTAIGLLARPGALLLTAGDVKPPCTLADAVARPGKLLGLHCPGLDAPGPLGELRPGPDASNDAVATALGLVRRLGLQAVRGTECAGGLTRHLVETLERCIEALLIGGHSGAVIDRALLEYGFATGPCAALDRRGLDRVLAHRRAIKGHDAPEVAVLDAMVETGLTGRRVGAGLLAWQGDVAAGEPAASRAVLRALGDLGVPATRDIPEPRIAALCAAALANAGAHLIADGLVGRASDVDVAAVLGLGFPRWRGGPMQAADRRGLMQVERDVAANAAALPLCPLFGEAIKNGRRLAALGDGSGQ